MKQGSPFIPQKRGKLMMCLFAAFTALCYRTGAGWLGHGSEDMGFCKLAGQNSLWVVAVTSDVACV